MINDILVESCITNSQSLFKELEGVFYPFGYTTKDNVKALPYYSYFENDFPDVKQVTERLVTCLINDLNNNEYSEIAICSLCSKIVDNITFDFLDIKVLNKNGISKDYVILVDTNFKDYTFEVIEIIEYDGTIELFYNKNSL